MALNFDIELDSCRAEAFDRAYSQEPDTWHKALGALSNASIFTYNSGTVIEFEDLSYFTIESHGVTTAHKNIEEYKKFFDAGIIEGRELCRELYKKKLEAEEKLRNMFKNFDKGNGNAYH